ncbi:MAG TPA: patatin-like phospholipase family protein [Steroidobacteraceae bacterium]|nr:patatin-like phospholipase family protein [Steroidobacteraceae bacterium]
MDPGVRKLEVSRLDRWLRMILWLTLANTLHIVALAVLPMLLATDQMVDAMRRLAEPANPIRSFGLLGGFSLAAAVLALSSALLGDAIRERIANLTVGAIPPRVVNVFSAGVVPVLMLLGVALIPARIAAQGMGLGSVKTGVLMLSVVIVGAVPLSLGFASFRKGLSIVQPVLHGVLLAFGLAAIVAISLSASGAIAFGPMGIVVLGVVFWAAALTQLFVAIPLFINSMPGAAGWIGGVAALFLLFHSNNPYRMPAVGSPSEDPETLAARVYDDSVGAFFEWLESRLPAEDNGAAIPVFLVAADGGGIRTGYYAARSLALLNQLTDGKFSRHTFTYSGVSGGSLGIAAFVDSVTRNPHDPGKVLREIDDFFAGDFLSPVIGRILIGDPLRYAMNLQSIDGRDQVFESLLHRRWHDTTGSSFFARPMLDALGRKAGTKLAPPVVTFNATIAESGGRLELSNLVHGRDTSDARSYFTFHRQPKVPSLTVSQAVHLSARFPGFSPPASVQAEMCDSPSQDQTEGKCEWVRRHWLTVVDGGYYDNSGLAPIITLIDQLTCIREEKEAEKGDARRCVRKTASLGVRDKDPATFDRRMNLLSRVSFHVVILAGNTEYKREITPGGKEKYVREGNLFDKPDHRRRAMLDIGAAVSALDGARQGRARESWRNLEILMNRFPSNSKTHRVDTNRLFSIDHGLYPFTQDKLPKFPSCNVKSWEELLDLVTDIPLGWVLSMRAQNGIKCATERTVDQRIQSLKDVIPLLTAAEQNSGALVPDTAAN